MYLSKNASTLLLVKTNKRHKLSKSTLPILFKLGKMWRLMSSILIKYDYTEDAFMTQATQV